MDAASAALSFALQILTLAQQLGPVVAKAAADFSEVWRVLGKVFGEGDVTDEDVRSLRKIADDLHRANQAAPETPEG